MNDKLILYSLALIGFRLCLWLPWHVRLVCRLFLCCVYVSRARWFWKKRIKRHKDQLHDSSMVPKDSWNSLTHWQCGATGQMFRFFFSRLSLSLSFYPVLSVQMIKSCPHSIEWFHLLGLAIAEQQLQSASVSWPPFYPARIRHLGSTAAPKQRQNQDR